MNASRAVVHRPAVSRDPGVRPAAAGVRQYATPPSERTRNTTSSRSVGEHVVYWIRQRPSALGHRPAVAVEQALEHGEADVRRR